MSLIQAYMIEQSNAGIDVVDLDVDGGPRILLKNSNLLGGRYSHAGSYRVYIPGAHVVRINEKRHLLGYCY